jgi:hypothetical protein
VGLSGAANLIAFDLLRDPGIAELSHPLPEQGPVAGLIDRGLAHEQPLAKATRLTLASLRLPTTTRSAFSGTQSSVRRRDWKTLYCCAHGRLERTPQAVVRRLAEQNIDVDANFANAEVRFG